MRNSVPRVTVLMSVFNGAPYLEECLASIWHQTFEDFEFLVLDDGSTDRTEEILASVRDSRFRFLRLKHVGLNRALNVGLKLGNGEYVARQDADDISFPDRLAKQVEYLDNHPEVALVGSGAKIVTDKGKIMRDLSFPTSHMDLVAELHRFKNPLPHTTIMFRRATILRYGGYRELFTDAEDYDLHLRLAETQQIASMHEPLCRSTYSMNSASCNDRQGQQFQYAVLAFISSVFRCSGLADPLESRTSNEFLAEFRAWYASSGYPDFFRAVKLRRQTRLALSEGQVWKALQYLLIAVRTDPQWVLHGLLPWSNDGVTSAAIAWVEGRLREVTTSTTGRSGSICGL